MKYHYIVQYQFSKLFNTLWRIAIGFPILLSALYYFLNFKMNSDFPFFIVVLGSLFILIIVYLIRFKWYGELKKSDVYTFCVTDKEITSVYPSELPHPLSYEINISDIEELIVKANNINSASGGGYWALKMKNGKRYQVSSNYVWPNKVFKILRSIRPELNKT